MIRYLGSKSASVSVAVADLVTPPAIPALKKSTIAFLIVVVTVLFGGMRWWSWSHGRVLASVEIRPGGRAVIREIPYTTNVIYWLSDSSGYIYRMELWRWPHIMTDCKTFSEDSYRAKSVRIDHTPERCVFYFDDRPSMTLTARGDWTR